MKKIFALLLLLALVVGVLVGCNQVSPTEKKVRWENNETWTYNISLANFEKSTTTTTGTYYQDFLIASETSPYANTLDRVAPSALTGQYVVTLKVDAEGKLATVSTTQTMNATYPKSILGDYAQFEHLVVETTADTVTLKSETQTKVVFKNNIAQTPVSSYTKVDGFYIGQRNQSVTQYEISTEYEVRNNKTFAKVTKNDKTEEIEIAGTSVIDTNQVLTYIRSFDKTSTSFQDSPQVLVFDALTATSRKMSFAYASSQNFLAEHQFAGSSETAQVATSVNRVDALLDGMAFMSQINLPDLTSKGLDQISSGEVIGVYAPKHTTYRFRVGFVSYQLANYVTDDIVKAIQAKAE